MPFITEKLMSVASRSDSCAQSASSSSGIVRSHFSTHGKSLDEQMLAWRERVGHVVDVPPSTPQIDNGFSGSIDRYTVGELIFTDVRTDATVLERSLARISTDKRRDYVFHIFTEGSVGNVTGIRKKRSESASAKGIAVLDLNQTFRIERPGCHVLSLFVPEATVEAAFPDADAIHGRIVAFGTPLTRIVVDHATALARELPLMNAADAASALDAGAQLLIAAFRKQTRLTGEARAAIQVALLGQVRRFIDAHLHHADLSPARVVEALQLKRATIYRWFEHEGGLGAYIRNRRLREAADELVRFPHLQVVEIAYGLGFKSASDFTRAFRRAYGMSPQDVRVKTAELQREGRGCGVGLP
jgi:AraC-like DNA-binding protein